MSRLDAAGGDRGPRASSQEQVRRENLSRVLRLVHSRRRVPRAEITRATGLNRSTVADLVAELVGLGLAFESEPERANQAGRPSPVVSATRRPVAIAVHPETDALTIGAVALDGTLVQRIRYPLDLPPTPSELVERASEVIAGLGLGSDAHPPIGIGVAAPGLVRSSDGIVRLAPHLGWEDVPLASLLQEATGLPMRIANDASVGALAEAIFGAGRGATDMVFLNGGSRGIGGGIIANGRPFGGGDGYAGEFGHTLVNSAGQRCQCGARGCLETEVRPEPLLAAFGPGFRALPAGEDVGAALTPSNREAVMDEARRQLGFLAVSLRNIVNAFNPQVIVLAGFLATLQAIDPGFLDRTLREQALTPPLEGAQIRAGALGSDLLMVGAAELAFGPLLDDPASQSPEGGFLRAAYARRTG